MNSKLILSVVTLFMLSFNVFASEPKSIQSEKITEFGKEIETISYRNNTNEVDKRAVSKFDREGKLIEKILYKWKAFYGWEPARKLEYTYNAANVLAQVSHCEWDEKNINWSKDVRISRYDVDATGNVFVAEVVKK